MSWNKRFHSYDARISNQTSRFTHKTRLTFMDYNSGKELPEGAIINILSQSFVCLFQYNEENPA